MGIQMMMFWTGLRRSNALIDRANKWDNGKKRRMISAYLRGSAGDHFEKINEDNKANFRIIKDSLIERFSPADMRRSAYSNLAGRKQGKVESVNVFASAIQRFVFTSFPSDVTNQVIEMQESISSWV